jgi:hypothetical protein
MKNFSLLFSTLMLIVIGCGQSNNDSQDNEMNSPGPITESDKNRYNLNPNDEIIYGSMDSVMRDSLRADSSNMP